MSSPNKGNDLQEGRACSKHLHYSEETEIQFTLLLNVIKMELRVYIFLSIILGYYTINQIKGSINSIQLKNHRGRDS